jgi:hypothetical protein
MANRNCEIENERTLSVVHVCTVSEGKSIVTLSAC